MSTLDQNWNRWIKMSVAMAFDTLLAAQTPSIAFVVNPDRLTNMAKEAVELALKGPVWVGLVKDVWRATFDVMVVVEVVDPDPIDRLEQIVGLIENTMAVPFKIYKVGSQAGDDPMVLVACTNQENPIKTEPRGLVRASVNLLQTTIQAKYSLILP